MNKIIIMKFGGASVATCAHFSKIADIILRRAADAHTVIVVSAMGDTTNQLLALARSVHPEPPLREQDMLVSVGERISIALLAMALHLKGREAISFTGSQSGILTTSAHAEAKICDVKPRRLLQALEANKIVIVAGFQGVSQAGEITTLGRGGSDTTAVALAVALKASHVEFYKDVQGIYAEDPKKNPKAKHYARLNYHEALEIIRKEGKVLHPRCLELAAKNHVPLHVISFCDPDLQARTIIDDGEKSKRVLCRYEDVSYEKV